MNIAEAESLVEKGEGIYGDKYFEALQLLAQEHQNDPCPPELARTKILSYEGFKCKVHYNYVPPYNYGAMTLNRWHGVLEGNPEGLMWQFPLNEGIKTLEEACEAIEPYFIKMIERWQRKGGF